MLFSRNIVLLFALLVASTPAFSQKLTKEDFLKPRAIKAESKWRPMGPMTAISSGVCFGGVGADVATSGGFNERNPLFRNTDGSINRGRAVAVGAGICGGTLAIEHFWPKTAKPMSILRFIMGSVHLGVAAHNKWGVVQ